MPMTTIDLGDELAGILRAMGQPIDKVARELIVLELYRRHTVSSGKAAELLGVDRYDFIRNAAQVGIPFFDLPEGELRSDLDRLGAE